MVITIHQPEHFPYMGYFQKMKAADMEFEEWRTKMANLRSERSRYGA